MKGTRTRALFIRLSDKEMKYFEAAVKLKYGKVDQYRSEFARKALLDKSVEIIKEAKRRREKLRERVEAED